MVETSMVYGRFRSRRRLVVIASVTVIALAALVASFLARQRWPEYGIEHETLAMARANLDLAPDEGGAIRFDSPTIHESIASLAVHAGTRAVSPRPDRVRELGGHESRLSEGVLLALETVLRRAADDPRAYIEWARARGCAGTEFPTPSHLIGPDGAPLYDAYEHAWRFTFNEPMPESTTPEQFVVAMLRATQSQYDGRAWVREILTDNGAVFVEASVADDRADGFEYTMIDRVDGPGSDFWFGSIGMRCERTLICGRSLAQVIDSHGEALVMHVRLAGLSPRKQVIPISCTVYFDPLANKWRMHAMDLSNVKEPVPYLAF